MGDRDKALYSIATCIPHCPNTEFIIIAILTTHSLHPPNPNVNQPHFVAAYIQYVLPEIYEQLENKPALKRYLQKHIDVVPSSYHNYIQS